MNWPQPLKRAHAILSGQFGIDPLRFIRAIMSLPRFVADLVEFRRRYRGRLVVWPCLHDRLEEAGVVRNEYFWQDLWVAQKIHDLDPENHVDVGSRLDGFIAHLASFREVQVVDVRPMSLEIPRVRFRQLDAMSDLPQDFEEYADSVSCLHTLEHVGLGRYGDQLDPLGYEKAFRNLARIVRKGGRLYLSVPCGQERVEFNAHRVFAPGLILSLGERHGLCAESIALVRADGVEEVDPGVLEQVAQQPYVLVIFVFVKNVLKV